MVQLGDWHFQFAKSMKILGLSTSVNEHALKALFWYRKASGQNHPLGSYYAAMIYHFGLEGLHPNPLRAYRYYGK